MAVGVGWTRICSNNSGGGDLNIVVQVLETHTSASLTIITDSDGTINSIDIGGLTGVAIEVNSAPVIFPFVLSIGDVVDVAFDAAVADDRLILIGEQ